VNAIFGTIVKYFPMKGFGFIMPDPAMAAFFEEGQIRMVFFHRNNEGRAFPTFRTVSLISTPFTSQRQVRVGDRMVFYMIKKEKGPATIYWTWEQYWMLAVQEKCRLYQEEQRNRRQREARERQAQQNQQRSRTNNHSYSGNPFEDFEDFYRRFYGSRGPQARRTTSNTILDWRTVLGIPNGVSVTKDMIRSYFRKKAKECHPDAGGSHEAMVRLNHAKETAMAYAVA
jgi:hypothetical protein